MILPALIYLLMTNPLVQKRDVLLEYPFFRVWYFYPGIRLIYFSICFIWSAN